MLRYFPTTLHREWSKSMTLNLKSILRWQLALPSTPRRMVLSRHQLGRELPGKIRILMLATSMLTNHRSSCHPSKWPSMGKKIYIHHSEILIRNSLIWFILTWLMVWSNLLRWNFWSKSKKGTIPKNSKKGWNSRLRFKSLNCPILSVSKLKWKSKTRI